LLSTEAANGLCSRIRSYYERYYAIVGGYGEKVLAVLPTFVRGPHRLQVFMCKDGISVVAYPSGTFDLVCRHLLDARVDATLNEQAGGMEWDLSGKFGMDIAGVALHKGDLDGPVVFTPEWDKIHVTSSHSPGKWTSHAATSDAHRDVAQLLAARLMEVPLHQAPAAGEKLGEALSRFEDLLSGDPAEEEVQVFLTENPVFLDPTALAVRPKVRLGSDYVTDFVIERREGEYELVEIEPPAERLYTKAGDPTARFSHAQRQVEDWREWVSENIAYARQSLPGISEPYCRVIIGRRTQLTPQAQKALRRRNQELHHVRIETYDDVIGRTRQALHNITSH
jgi:hypothetical protein